LQPLSLALRRGGLHNFAVDTGPSRLLCAMPDRFFSGAVTFSAPSPALCFSYVKELVLDAAPAQRLTMLLCFLR